MDRNIVLEILLTCSINEKVNRRINYSQLLIVQADHWLDNPQKIKTPVKKRYQNNYEEIETNLFISLALYLIHLVFFSNSTPV